MALLIGIVLLLVVLQVLWLAQATQVQKAKLKDELNKSASELVKYLNEDYYCFDMRAETIIEPGGEFSIQLPKDSTNRKSVRLFPSSIHGQNPDSVFEKLNFSVPVEVLMDLHFELLPEDELARDALNDRQLNILQSYERCVLFEGRRWLDTVTFNQKIKELRQLLAPEMSISVRVLHNENLVYARSNNSTESTFKVSKVLYENVPFIPALTVEFGGINNAPFYKVPAFKILVLSLILLIALLVLSQSLLKTIRKEKRLSHLKNELIANITHEFNTPVTNIGLALRNINPSSEKEQLAKSIIEEENKRISRNIEWVMAPNSINDFIENKQVTEVDIHEVIEMATDHVSPVVQEKGGKLEMSLNATDFTLMGDESQLLIAIENLLDNAVKYSPETPKIRVSTYNKGHKLFVEIADKGIGMSPEELNLIFDQFYRVSNSYKHDVKGFGLGLYYAQNVAKMHKGQLLVNSKLGEGSTFTYSFNLK